MTRKNSGQKAAVVLAMAAVFMGGMGCVPELGTLAEMARTLGALADDAGTMLGDGSDWSDGDESGYWGEDEFGYEDDFGSEEDFGWDDGYDYGDCSPCGQAGWGQGDWDAY